MGTKNVTRKYALPTMQNLRTNEDMDIDTALSMLLSTEFEKDDLVLAYIQTQLQNNINNHKKQQSLIKEHPKKRH